MNKLHKGIVLCVLCCAVLFWCFRIYSVNQTEVHEDIFQIGEEFQIGGINIVPSESHLFSKEAFLEYFRLTEDDLIDGGFKETRYICVCLSASNTTEQDISWDEVMDRTSGGFQTKTWGSISSPYEGKKLNVFRDECLRAGQSQNIWYVTSVNSVSFKQRTWEQMECEDFSYVLTELPTKTSIRLG